MKTDANRDVTRQSLETRNLLVLATAISLLRRITTGVAILAGGWWGTIGLATITSISLDVAGNLTRITPTIRGITVVLVITTIVSTTSGAVSTLRTSISHIDLDASAIELSLIETINGVGGLLLGAVGDETETSRATSISVAHHDGVEHSAEIGKSLP